MRKLAAITLAATLVLTACSSDADGGTATSTTSATTQAPTTTEPRRQASTVNMDSFTAEADCTDLLAAVLETTSDADLTIRIDQLDIAFETTWSNLDAGSFLAAPDRKTAIKMLNGCADQLIIRPASVPVE